MTYPTTTINLNGKNITIETGRFGAQASGAVTVRCGDTMVLAAFTASKVREGIDYFPLSIEYQEKLYAGGVISSSRFVKREGRPSENEVLTGRLVDRSLRPLFDQSSRNDVQIMISPLSIDGVEEPEILAVIAASAAASISHYPWLGPVGAVRVGMTPEGEFIVNPTNEQKALSALDLVVSGPKGGIAMVESGAKEVSEEKMIEALKFAQGFSDQVAQAIADFAKEHGKEKISLTPKEIPGEVREIVEKELGDLSEILKNEALKTGTQMSQLVADIALAHPEFNPNDIYAIADELLRNLARRQILDKSDRPDGRKLDEVRQINVEVGLLPRTHGSGFFQRGLTHVLSVVTLASPAREQTIDGMKGEATKRYMHHYNMPGYASGEVGRPGTGRREIGHGALAEKALIPVLPDQQEFPYAIRVVSEVLSSNGSTSQGSVCGSTLALMDAGVPIKKPVAGVAMGLISEGEKNITLTDICGLEDHLGDMDFKVSGTADGITALQMDVKVTGINAEVLGEAITQAKSGRLTILEKMIAVIKEPRSALSQYAPKIVSTKVPEDRIGDVIGSGGKVIRGIQEDFEVEVNVEEDGTITVAGIDQAKVDGARAYIDSLVAEAEIGATYQGSVARIEAFGAFVNILPGKDGLVHISQIYPEAFKALKVGDKLEVRVRDVDDLGRVNLTTLKEGERPVPPQPRREGEGGGERRFQGGGGGGRPPFKRFRDNR
ncbi:MAG: pnp, polynucleotide phosphorylase, polyribonucleotide nucleotidyltransferase [Candidatus Collierbacteria bacterium GW2011_GWC1_45_47]|uniref:Polyribonucleotide nucleotidyltransferase n=5 Tax=Candidatus Collieribacteriota TaxID=1752725 RepID=A0A0G1JQ34_9BACT|nr:MAG: Polyribonucleotide nucleotidyltransferase [Candidatus Collierbacteria bacterium GW2011_GWA1_44_12]KKT39472.1 MAG: Polyribonucleotide nucleotidyltransferase [Candidatus Collierbacteria bacterium GW2011_GWF1_44_12]KKT46072.1 MAG: Polyribonucleotide nucleotidyltransferase [Candidatus Collierbacteria bacterium GW2011_GWF2_44_15]KKT99625.1 MAG: Polyribonucleotide nucleotidyltransferase [Candidatus Collierbacteria bacterium GW2011_GWC2_45_15]KKU09447.1 MAG: pnp, polynucleotide phosphorylase, 